MLELQENFDIIYVEYSTDAINWSLLGSSSDANWYNSKRIFESGEISSDCQNCPGGQWTGSNNTFSEYSYDLSGFRNEANIIFRFVFHSDASITDEGVVIDDFVIEEVGIIDDQDNDGVLNDVDLCPNTPSGEIVDSNGCWIGELDDDNDGVQNSLDLCPATPPLEFVDVNGCGESQLDDDNDGVMNDVDSCPNTPALEVVNTDGCGDSQLDDDNDGVQNSSDLCPTTPSLESVDVNGCGDSQLDDDIDGIMNNVDSCPNTPALEVVNTDGCGDSQLDDDTDGVMNNKDICPETTPNAMVDSSGCFTLSASNFSIEVTSETCPSKDNGQISISAAEAYTYTTTINGVNYTFDSSNNALATDLPPGLYTVCVSVTGETFVQCFEVEIIAGEVLVANATVTLNKTSIEIKKGTAPFSIYVNGEESFKTNALVFNVDVKHGDFIEVKSSKSCEGIFAKTIDFPNSILAYPNPTNGVFDISLPVSQKGVMIELYTIHSQLISSRVYPIVYGKVQLNIEDQPTGLYIVKLVMDSPVTLKILKQ